MPVLVLLCLGMAACARTDRDAADSSPPRAPEGGEAQAGTEPGPESSTRREEGPARDSGPTLAMGIATGPRAVEARRRTLTAGPRALGRDALGYFMDVHEARLLQSLGDSVRLRREESEFGLQIAGRAGFAAGSAHLNASLQRELQSVAEVLVEFDHTLVVVRTHTDASGPTDYNQELSERRALRVAEELVDNGVDPERVVAVGYGESRPIADNDTASGRARNRRVEIVIEAIVHEPQD